MANKPQLYSVLRIWEMFIPDPESEFRIPDPVSGSALKNLSIFNPKNCL